MSKFSRIAVMVTALASLLAAMSSTAGAVTWTNTGNTTFHATGGPGTLSIGPNSLVCGGSTAEGNAPMHSSTSTIVTGTIVFQPCSLVGQPTFVHCTYQVIGNVYNAGVTTGGADVACDARLTANPTPSLCHISGRTPITYTNASVSPGRFTLDPSNTLVVSNGDVACPLGTGNGALTEQTINVTTIAESPTISTP